MKNCHSCNQPLAEGVRACPLCGAEMPDGPAFIGNYRIVSAVREGYASLLYRAIPKEGGDDVLIRLFKPDARMDEEKAARLRHEIEQLRQLPGENFVRHESISRTDDGQWYRVSEWVEAEDWAILRGSGLFTDPAQRRRALDLFAAIAQTLDTLHRHGHIIPHLILCDTLVCRASTEGFKVKIDYKLSRFLDPRLAHPSPQLRQVLESHPDILAGCPLDRRSDVWSLGKIFAELLTGVYGIEKWEERIVPLYLPERLISLLRQMLETDPDKRIGSMSEVVQLLSRVTPEELERAANPVDGSAVRLERRTIWLQRALVSVALVMALIGGLGVFLQMRYGIFSHNDSRIFARHAERYSRSVALVAVEYWLEDFTGKVLATGSSQGTAFLADREGYLISNRHVVCPWLVDDGFREMVARLSAENHAPFFKYRTCLWFEGAKGIKRQQEQIGNSTITDHFYTNTGYCSDGGPRVTIAGVVMPPTESIQLLRSPLGDDVAILKIDSVPHGVVPIPLDPALKSVAGKKLSPIMTIGFPGGKQNIADNQVTANTTIGHIRAIYNNLLLGNISLHSGNSGGPVISQDGTAIGIASAVRVDNANLILFSIPIAQSDFAEIFPIAPAQALLTRIKAGEPAWNGVPDPPTSARIRELVANASKGNLEEARQWVEERAESSVDPVLLTFCGLIHVCLNEPAAAEPLLRKAVAINPGNGSVRFLHYLNDWQAGNAATNRYREELLALDWRSPDEFWGYMTHILEGQIAPETAENASESVFERDMLDWALAIMDMQSGSLDRAEERLRKALLHDDGETWNYLLIRARLEQVEREREKQLNESDLARYRSDQEAYRKRCELASAEVQKKKEDNAALAGALGDPKSAALILRKIVRTAPDAPCYQISLCYYEALLGHWKNAYLALKSYLSKPGRESANRLGAGLFSAQLLAMFGQQGQSYRALEAYTAQTNDPWYRKLAQGVLGEIPADVLEAEASECPEKLLTCQAMLGLKAEGENNPVLAQQHYALAFESFLPNWLEYQFAKERLRRLRTGK